MEQCGQVACGIYLCSGSLITTAVTHSPSGVLTSKSSPFLGPQPSSTNATVDIKITVLLYDMAGVLNSPAEGTLSNGGALFGGGGGTSSSGVSSTGFSSTGFSLEDEIVRNYSKEHLNHRLKKYDIHITKFPTSGTALAARLAKMSLNALRI